MVITFSWQADILADQTCSKDACDVNPNDVEQDPRTKYDVQMNSYVLLKDYNITKIITEITEKSGYVVLPQLFTPEDISHARDLVLYLIKQQGQRVTHFQGSKDSNTKLQARVWNLLNKGRIFEKMIQHPLVIDIAQRILGDNCQLGSIATNTIFQGVVGKNHILIIHIGTIIQEKHWPFPPKVKAVLFI